ncbi:hypothetical protein DFH06DRAFT_1203662 [Mycena polygramma]|nr:hypothetical protein DFH06DRAFT_1203662 [Mycena polygramma]
MFQEENIFRKWSSSCRSRFCKTLDLNDCFLGGHRYAQLSVSKAKLPFVQDKSRRFIKAAKAAKAWNNEPSRAGPMCHSISEYIRAQRHANTIFCSYPLPFNCHLISCPERPPGSMIPQTWSSTSHRIHGRGIPPPHPRMPSDLLLIAPPKCAAHCNPAATHTSSRCKCSRGPARCHPRHYPCSTSAAPLRRSTIVPRTTGTATKT